jgi:hypothetical protein
MRHAHLRHQHALLLHSLPDELEALSPQHALHLGQARALRNSGSMSQDYPTVACNCELLVLLLACALTTKETWSCLGLMVVGLSRGSPLMRWMPIAQLGWKSLLG